MLAEAWKRVGVCADSKSWHLAGSSDSTAGPICRAGLVLGSEGSQDLGSNCLPPVFSAARDGPLFFFFIKRALSICLGRIFLFPWNVVVCSLKVRSETREDGEAEE